MSTEYKVGDLTRFLMGDAAPAAEEEPKSKKSSKKSTTSAAAAAAAPAPQKNWMQVLDETEARVAGAKRAAAAASSSARRGAGSDSDASDTEAPAAKKQKKASTAAAAAAAAPASKSSDRTMTHISMMGTSKAPSAAATTSSGNQKPKVSAAERRAAAIAAAEAKVAASANPTVTKAQLAAARIKAAKEQLQQKMKQGEVVLKGRHLVSKKTLETSATAGKKDVDSEESDSSDSDANGQHDSGSDHSSDSDSESDNSADANSDSDSDLEDAAWRKEKASRSLRMGLDSDDEVESDSDDDSDDDDDDQDDGAEEDASDTGSDDADDSDEDLSGMSDFEGDSDDDDDEEMDEGGDSDDEEDAASGDAAAKEEKLLKAAKRAEKEAKAERRAARQAAAADVAVPSIDDLENEEEADREDYAAAKLRGDLKSVAAKAAKGDSPYDVDTRIRRTMFVGNVSVKTTEKALRKVLRQFGTIESLRLRSIAFSDPALPRRAAKITKKFHAMRDSCNAYVVYATEEQCREAIQRAHGLEVDGHRLRCDLATTPQGSTGVRDLKKSVFVGNLPFDTNEEELRAFFDEKVGQVRSVRLIRDRATNFGKGFGYVAFEDRALTKPALSFHGVEFKGRALRIFPAAKPEKLSKMLGYENADEVRGGKDGRATVAANTVGFHRRAVEREARKRKNREENEAKRAAKAARVAAKNGTPVPTSSTSSRSSSASRGKKPSFMGMTTTVGDRPFRSMSRAIKEATKLPRSERKPRHKSRGGDDAGAASSASSKDRSSAKKPRSASSGVKGRR